MDSPRIDAIVSAAKGTSCPIVRDSAEKVGVSISEMQRKRLESAVSEQIRVFPERLGLYRVYSNKNKTSEYTTDIKYRENRTCSCDDFMFRIDKSKGQMCKHLWKTHILITLGALPEATTRPYRWLLSEIETDMNLLREAEKNGHATPNSYRKMKNLQQEIEASHQSMMDYETICLTRASILENA